MEAPSISFDRSVRPKNAVGRPELIGYWDGSDLAYAAVIYVRWQLAQEDDEDSVTWHVSLLTAKARVTPVSGITTQRSELNGLVVLGRIMSTVVKCMPRKQAELLSLAIQNVP